MRLHANSCLVVGALAAAAALGSGAARAEDPPAAPAAVSYADVSARLAKADAPLWLHLRLEADGRLGLRSRRAAPDAAWTACGAWRLTGTGAEDAQALEQLRRAIAAAHGEGETAAALREAQGISRGRLLVDCAPGATWGHLTWCVAAAADRDAKVSRLTFLTGGTPAWVDQDLPQDRGVGSPRPLESARWITAALVRNPASGEGAAERTRIGVSHALRRHPAERPDAVAPGGPGEGAGAEGQVVPFFLPGDETAKEARAEVWGKVSEHLKAIATGADGRLGATVRTPPPHGQRVHALDVVQLLVRLQDAGCRAVEFEGTAPPR